MVPAKRRPWRAELRVTAGEERVIRAAARAAGMPVATYLKVVALGGMPRATTKDLDSLDGLIALREGQQRLLDQLADERGPGLERLRAQIAYQVERMGALLEAAARMTL